MVYNYCNEKGFDILLQSKMRVGQYEGFNDPFELVFRVVDSEEAYHDIEREYLQYPGIIDEWKELFQIKDENICDTDIAKIVAERQLINIHSFRKEQEKHWKETMGILCLSKQYDIIQMWGHYANNHKGIVIGIDESVFGAAIKEVNYKDQIVCLHISTILDEAYYEKCFKEIISQKEPNWSYEKEVRVYVLLKEKDPDGHYYIELHPSAIKEIYLGLRADEMTKILANAIREREEYQHLKLYQMKKQDKYYGLIPEEF